MVNHDVVGMWQEGRQGHREDRPLVVVIDDTPAIRKFVSRNLARRGYQVTAASSVYSARHMLAVRRPRLVILEPQVHGSVALLATMAADARLAGTPLLLFTTQNLAHNAGLGDYPWVAGVLFKPVSTADLIEMVDRVTGSRRIMDNTELLW